MTSTRAGADIDCANTTIAYATEARDVLRRLKGGGFLSSKEDRRVLDGLIAVAENAAARLMLRNGVGLEQEELFQAEAEPVAAKARSSKRKEQVGA